MRGIKLSIILVLVIMLSVGTMFAANITVATASDLWSLRQEANLDGNHTQTADIDLSTPDWTANNLYKVGKVVSYDGYAYCCDTGHTSGDNFDAAKWTKMWEIAEGWMPIGTPEAAFYGQYDGGTYKIFNLYINRGAGVQGNNELLPPDGADNVGLFGYVSNRKHWRWAWDFSNGDVVIKNVKLEDVNVTGKRGTGALIGKILLPWLKKNTVIVENCYVTGGSVKGFGATGGLVGANNSDRKQVVPIIRSCYASVAVSSTHPQNTHEGLNIKYGGLVGCNENGITQDCYATGAVIGGDRVGGLAGCTIGGAIFRSFATGAVTQKISIGQSGYGPIVGMVEGSLPSGLGGTNAPGAIENSYYLDTSVVTSTVNKTKNSLGIEQTSGQLTDATTYPNWNSSVWNFDTGYPTLKGATAPKLYFKSIAGGTFATVANWEHSLTEGGGTSSTDTPDYSNSVSIIVQNTHTINVPNNTKAYISSTTVEAGGTLQVNAGGTLNIEHRGDDNLDDLVVIGNLVVKETGKLNIGQSATVRILGSITSVGELDIAPNSNTTITFNGTTVQASPGLLNSFHNLTINNSAGVTFPERWIIVNGTFTHTAGDYTGQARMDVDSLSSSGLKRISWSKTGSKVEGYSAETTVIGSESSPKFIRRSWNIGGGISATDKVKKITFYWDASEDYNYVWGETLPTLHVGDTKTTATSFDITGNTRAATFTYTFGLPAKSSKGIDFKIGLDGFDTLPVLLSSFTAINSLSNGVMIQWVSQSESDLDGYRIYRNNKGSLEEALMLDAFFAGTNTTQTQTYTYFDKEELSNGVHYYWIQMIDYDGTNSFYGPAPVEINNEYDNSVEIPLVNGIASIYPNPFNPVTTIRYSKITDAKTIIELYNLRGQRVKLIDPGYQEKGFYNVVWDGTDNRGQNVASGIYFTRITIGKTVDMKKIVLMK